MTLRPAIGIAIGAVLAAACSGETEEPTGATTGTSSSTVAGTGGGGGAGGSMGGGGAGGDAAWLDAQHEPCPPSGCPAPLECVMYCGKAGCNGGMFSSCEVECDPANPTCPGGQICVSIADGPGNVCAHQ